MDHRKKHDGVARRDLLQVYTGKGGAPMEIPDFTRGRFAARKGSGI